MKLGYALVRQYSTARVCMILSGLALQLVCRMSPGPMFQIRLPSCVALLYVGLAAALHTTVAFQVS